MGCRGFNVFASVILSLVACNSVGVIHDYAQSRRGTLTSRAARLVGQAESPVWPGAGEARLSLSPMAIVIKDKIRGIW